MRTLWIVAVAAGAAGLLGVSRSVSRSTERSGAVFDARTMSDMDSLSVSALLDSVVPIAMRSERIPGAVVAVVADNRVLFARGYGVSDLGTRQAVSPESTIFRIGSISKVFTATAVVQLADRGTLDLRTDVNRYLRRLTVPETFRAPITAWHLLTHTAALDEIRPGTQAASESGLLPLDRFLRGKLVRVTPPGEVTSYSTYGMTVAGLLVEDVSRMSYADYLTRNVWMPLDMDHTSVRVPSADERLVATPYDVDNDAVVRAPWEWYHTTPASSINSTGMDMARFMATLLNDGALPTRRANGVEQRVLSARAVRNMLTQQITMHPRLPGFSLGWQMIDTHGEMIAEHGGDVAGFSSLMTLLLKRRIGIFTASHREGSNVRFAVRDALLDRYFPDTRPLPASVRSDPVRSRAFAGHYRASIVCHSCAQPRPVTEVDVIVNADGTLQLWDAKWHELAPDYFRSTDGKDRVGFRRDAKGNVTHMSLGSYRVFEKVQ